ncbi:MAG TPA: hypothetical protein VF247_00285 [Candidatus Krumholzibacteria bacterium]
MLAVAGCGGPAVTRAPSSPPCATRTPAAHPADILTVVLFDTVDLSHAPWGRNREERFVFSHLYETLLTVDCHGQLQPGLAKRWVEASDGWLIEMRDDARFWDQTSVTAYEAADVIKRASAQGIVIKSVDVIDEHSMILHGYSGRPDLKLLSLQMLAVTKSSPNGVVPMGSGPWMLDEDMPVAEAVVIRPSSEAETPIVRFVQGDVGDARDIFDGTADAMITDDPAAIEYARAKKNVTMAPLAWDLVYVVISRERNMAYDDGIRAPLLSAATCAALARDAVQKEARGGSSLLADGEHAGCKQVSTYARQSVMVASQKRVAFAVDDATARSLAERLVALAAMDTTTSSEARDVVRALPGSGRSLRATGIPSHEMDRRMAQSSGEESAYVTSLSWCVDFPCTSNELLTRAPWLLAGSGPLSRKIIPLVETRAHFIAISDRIGYIDDHNGDVRILGPSVVRVQ